MRSYLNLILFVSLILYGIYFDGPNENYTSWHQLLVLYAWWLFNEIVVKNIVYTRYPDYDRNGHILWLLQEKFGDERGFIQPLCDLNMKSASLIFTKPGQWRANHYHKKDWHFIYVISDNNACLWD